MNGNLSKLLALALVLVTFFACNASQTKNGEGHETSEAELIEKSVETAKVSDYFPSNKMTKVFSGGFENEGMKHVVLSVQNNQVQILQQDTGTSLFLVYEVSEDQIKLIFSEEEYYSTEKIENVTPNRNNIILKAPLVVGTKWDSEHGGFFEITATNSRITIPAGTYKAVEVTFTFNEYQTKFYYAKGLGIIKTVSDFATTEMVEVR